MRIVTVACVLALAACLAWGQIVDTDSIGVVVGGFGGGITCEGVTSSSTCYQPIPDIISGSIEGWTAEYVDDALWVCGGSNINFRSDCYTWGGGPWYKTGEMPHSREYGSSFIFNGQMVVAGGYNDRQGWLNFIDRKASNGDTWESDPNWRMPNNLFNLCAEAMDNNRIIITGGDKFQVGGIDNVDILDTTTNTWTEGAKMTFARTSHGCLTVNYNGKQGLMVTGGCINRCQGHVNTTEFYSFSDNTWEKLPDLNEARMGHKMTFIDGKPAVVGGYESSLMNGVEIFDGTAWVKQSQKLFNARWAYGMPKSFPPSLINCN